MGNIKKKWVEPNSPQGEEVGQRDENSLTSIRNAWKLMSPRGKDHRTAEWEKKNMGGRPF